MKKNSFLLILFLISLTAFSQEEVIWSPANGSIYGDKIQITVFGEDYIENQFIGYNEGEIIQVPVYYLNGFNAPATDFEWEVNNAMYVSQLDYPALYADKDVNAITISYKTTGSITHFDTAEYYYSKPVLECLFVNGEMYQEDMILVNSEMLSLEVKIYSSHYSVPVNQITGDDFIASLYQVFDNSSVTEINIPDTRFHETTLGVDISDLTYGLHDLELYVKGRKANESYPDEFSEKIKIRILKFDFIIEDDDDFSVCKCDSLYFLSGLPKGGIFSGEGVIDSSNVFNPTISPNQSTTVTYRYPVDNEYYSNVRTISFDPLPVISLDAQTLAGIPHEVCGFEHGAVYELSGSDINSTIWILPVNIIKNYYFETDKKVIIDWKESGDGSIYVTAISDKGCKSRLEHMVHIGHNKSPEDSAYVTLYDKMLFCDTEAEVYNWYKINPDLSEEFLNTSDKPYYLLSSKPLAGESFYVWTAEDTTSCATHSHIFTVPADDKSQKDMNEDDIVILNIFPNPSNEFVNCEFLLPVPEGLLTVTNVYGQKMSRFECYNVSKGDIIRFETKDYQRGVYFLSVSIDEISKSYKFIVY